jgi:hypothetical protein
LTLTDNNDKEINTLDASIPYIYSMHGSCSSPTKEELLKTYFAINNFTDFTEIKQKYTRDTFCKKLIEIKEDMVKLGIMTGEEDSKKRCLFTISHWIYTMAINDIVFVRKTNNEVYICKVISEANLANTTNNLIYPKREIKILHKSNYQEIITKVDCLKNRLDSRRTLERVANSQHYQELQNFLLTLNKSSKCCICSILTKIKRFFVNT